MKTTNNTVLIIGGSAGIGLEIAKAFSERNNHVIITGRDNQRLQKAAKQLDNVTAIVSDITDADQVDQLVARLNNDFPNLNLVINNAGKAFVYDLSEEKGSFLKAEQEIFTNYLSIIRLNEKLLPLLQQQPESAIVNVSSIAAFAAYHKLGTYGASKAALHSYTQSLRISLQNSSVKVFELMPPLVDTEFSVEIGGHNGISPKVVADELLQSLETNNYEIHVGGTAQFYQLFHSSPAEALVAMNSR